MWASSGFSLGRILRVRPGPYHRRCDPLPSFSEPVLPNRTVFFVSDGTGITAETFGNSILAQFPTRPRHVRRPFIDSVDKADTVVGEINTIAQAEGRRPIVFITLVNDEV